MKILQIIPGSGGSFYCGNCLRDSKYVEAIRKLGHEVVKLPMYLPLFADDHDLNRAPVFYGAISIYLKQQYPIFRKAPVWVDNFLNSPPMLKLAARFSGSTRAKGLEEMTVSMLMGEDGQQKEELERMVDWIANHYQPDVIHLSNALLLGLAHRIKQKINVPVVCSLQDEDVWVDGLEETFRKKIWNLMAEKAKYVDQFIAVSDFYAGEMRDLMALKDDKLESLHIGVDPEDYRYRPVSEKRRNIGFVSRMCYENGLDILVDAFIELKKQKGFEDVKLILTGGSTGDDIKFIRGIMKKLKEQGLFEHVEMHHDFEHNGIQQFFGKVSVLSVPVRKGEAFGLYLLESMASGVPVVQPALGAFPEIIRKSGGGVVYEKNVPSELSGVLAALLADPDQLNELSTNGREGIETYFNIYLQAQKMIELYLNIGK